MRLDSINQTLYQCIESIVTLMEIASTKSSDIKEKILENIKFKNGSAEDKISIILKYKIQWN